MSVVDALQRSEVFLGLDDKELLEIASLPSTHEVTYPPGHVVCRGGTEAKYMFILESGLINLYAEPPNGGGKTANVVVDVVTKGGVLGWSAVVKPYLYVLNAVCQEQCQVTVLKGSELLALFEKNNAVGYRILQSLIQVISSRFRDLQTVVIKGKRWPFIEHYTAT